MKNEKKLEADARLLELLKEVLPKATPDPRVAGRIYTAVEGQLKARARVVAFEQFCRKRVVADLEPKSVAEVKSELTTTFAGGDVTTRADRRNGALAVEVSLTDGTQLQGEIKVDPEAAAAVGTDEGEPEPKLKFVPFPVSLPGDAELVWALARQENLTAEEGAMALTRVVEDFWASKQGQKLLREGVERSFADFVSRVPAGLLADAGLKRHYREPEPVHVMRAGEGQKPRSE